MAEEVSEYLSFQNERAMENAIALNFPEIKNLSVTQNKEGIISVKFDDNGKPTEMEVEEFIKSLKKKY